MAPSLRARDLELPAHLLHHALHQLLAGPVADAVERVEGVALGVELLGPRAVARHDGAHVLSLRGWGWGGGER
jgi:hypothetical protein